MILSPFSRPLEGKIFVPGSKSITNRVLPLAVLSSTPVILKNILKSEDTEIMQQVLTQIGGSIQQGSSATEASVSSGEFFSNTNTDPLFCGNSGTTLRFLTALSVLRKAPTTLTGIERMQQRPIGDLTNALTQIGCNIEYHNTQGFPPLTVFPTPLAISSCTAFSGLNRSLTPVSLSGKLSSQFFTALFHIAPYIGMEISVEDELVSKPYIDMTLAILHDFGISVENHEYMRFRIPQQSFSAPFEYAIEADASSASYPLSIALLSGGMVEIEHLPQKSLQGDAQFASVICSAMKPQNNKPCSISNPLLPLGEIDLEDMPDVAMTAVVLCAYAKGYSKITGLSTLRHKECDRLFALESNLQKMGGRVKATSDSIEIWGDPESLHGADIECFSDHRVAMCFAVLGTVVEGINILDPECVQKTYPTFWDDRAQWKNGTPA